MTIDGDSETDVDWKARLIYVAKVKCKKIGAALSGRGKWERNQ